MLTGVFSVVYPGVEPFLGDFLQSLATQGDRDFVLFLINDGCAGLDRSLAAYPLNVEVKESSGSPTALRKAGIAWVAAAGAEIILFADADDYFAPNRIGLSKSRLSGHDIICNELMVVGSEIPSPFGMLGTRLKEAEVISSAHILHGNCLGLSNTAIRASMIPDCLDQIPDEMIAIDWTFFSLCLHFGAKAVFTQKTMTYYRQHGNNTAFIRPLTEEQILRGVRVKADHYRFLSKYQGEVAPLAANFGGLLAKLTANGARRREYCRAVQRLSAPAPYWWEPIKTMEELGL